MMRKRNLTGDDGITAANDRTGRAAMVGLTEGTFFRNLVKFGNETMNFVNRNELCGARWRKQVSSGAHE